MAGDWIKIRGGTINDPKVIGMSKILVKNKRFREFLSPNIDENQLFGEGALRCVTTALLVVTWSWSRENGKACNGDCFLPYITIDDLDEIAGVNGFGRAMESVGWAENNEDPKGVLLPKFFIDMNVPKTSAEKQREYRERKKKEKNNKSVTQALPSVGNKSVTRGEEKRREDIKELSINKQTFIDTKKKNGLVAENQETKKDRKPRVSTQLVEKIFQDWKAILNHPGANIGKKRGDVIREAVRMGYTAEQMHEAFIGCARSSFHAGFNEQGKKYDDLELILRNEKNIDRFIAYSTQPPKPTWKPQDNTTLNVRREAKKYYESACEDARCGIDIVGTGATIDAESWEVLQPNLAH